MPGFMAAAAFMALAARPVPRVHLKGDAGSLVLEAVQDAGRRLRAPGCRAVLDDFAVADALAASGLEPEQWLARLVFADGVGQGVCRRSGVLFATEPGSRVVFARGRNLLRRGAGTAELAPLLVIHELLHSLGVPEGPPTSAEITEAVRGRCGP